MKALVQRVHSASVSVDGQCIGAIGEGLLVYVGIALADGSAEADKLARKVAHLRIFEDEGGKLNRSVQDAGGQVLVVPNFTLMADASTGRRPAFAAAAPAGAARPLHERFLQSLRDAGCEVAVGAFGAHMHVTSEADGPVNLLVEAPPS